LQIICPDVAALGVRFTFFGSSADAPETAIANAPAKIHFVISIPPRCEQRRIKSPDLPLKELSILTSLKIDHGWIRRLGPGVSAMTQINRSVLLIELCNLDVATAICPLRVNASICFPLWPQQRTSLRKVGMSVSCHEQTLRSA
jgi:hypothetical protein